MKSVFGISQRLTRIVNFRVSEDRYQRLKCVRERAREMDQPRDWFQATMEQALDRVCRDAERELDSMASRSEDADAGGAGG